MTIKELVSNSSTGNLLQIFKGIYYCVSTDNIICRYKYNETDKLIEKYGNRKLMKVRYTVRDNVFEIYLYCEYSNYNGLHI